MIITISTLIQDIKKKKELQAVHDSFVEKEINRVLTQKPALQKILHLGNSRSREYKTIIKEVRARLRKVSGVFRSKHIKHIKGDTLETHASTTERLSFYPRLYAQLFAITGTPKVILDLGCGLNPLSLPFMNIEKVTYYAYDINVQEIHVISQFFTQGKKDHPFFIGKASILDISDTTAVKHLPRADVCFLFKVTDALDRNKGHTASEQLIRAIPARYVILSFSTKTLSGKPMTAPRRRWVEWMCQRIGYPYTILEFENEIFYVVRKAV
ncbi:MAG: hypothetical protein AABX37_03650 [Nanoarchaeota archaeon]